MVVKHTSTHTHFIEIVFFFRPRCKTTHKTCNYVQFVANQTNNVAKRVMRKQFIVDSMHFYSLEIEGDVMHKHCTVIIALLFCMYIFFKLSGWPHIKYPPAFLVGLNFNHFISFTLLLHSNPLATQTNYVFAKNVNKCSPIQMSKHKKKKKILVLFSLLFGHAWSV